MVSKTQTRARDTSDNRQVLVLVRNTLDEIDANMDVCPRCGVKYREPHRPGCRLARYTDD